MTESQLQSKILQYLKTQPHTFCIKTIKTNARGTPDIIIVYRGFFIFIEVKRPDTRPRATPLQLHTMEALISAGARGFITNDYTTFLSTYTAITTSIDNLLTTLSK